jgi:hypothetical protein
MPATIHCFVLLQLKYHHGKLLTLLGKFAQIILKKSKHLEIYLHCDETVQNWGNIFVAKS